MTETGMRFDYCHSSDPGTAVTVTVVIDEDSNLEKVAEAFKAFLLACGYKIDDVDIT